MSKFDDFVERLKIWLLIGAGWALACLFLLASVGSLWKGAWVLSQATLLVALAIMPAVRIPARLRPASIIGALVLMGVAAGFEGVREADHAAADAEAAEVARLASKTAEFSERRDEILRQMRSAIDAGEPLTALRTGVAYRETEDEALLALMDEAEERKNEADRRNREAELVANVRGIPASNLEANEAAYRELMALNPDNARYRERFDHYSSAIRTERETRDAEVRRLREARAALIARFGPEPEPSAWDGSYREVKDYLRRIANDPSSIDIDTCTRVYQGDSGWLVGCDYRGANAFGALIKTSNWFTLRHGQVVLMEDASAHRVR